MDRELYTGSPFLVYCGKAYTAHRYNTLGGAPGGSILLKLPLANCKRTERPRVAFTRASYFIPFSFFCNNYG